MESGRLLSAALLVLLLSSAHGDDAGGGGSSLPCVKELLPCRPFLKGTTPPPPPTCCEPLKKALKEDVQCMCTVFNNEVLLQSFNVTKDEALQLPKACGADADLSLCDADVNNGTATAPTSASPSTGTTTSASSAANTTPASDAVPKKGLWGSGGCAYGCLGTPAQHSILILLLLSFLERGLFLCSQMVLLVACSSAM